MKITSIEAEGYLRNDERDDSSYWCDIKLNPKLRDSDLENWVFERLLHGNALGVKSKGKGARVRIRMEILDEGN